MAPTSALRVLASAARHCSRTLARAPSGQRSAAILGLADGLQQQAQAIEHANKADVEAAQGQGLASAMVDRLLLQGDRLQSLQDAMRSIAAQADPLGTVSRTWERPNGLRIERVRLPLGVILMIYEARPNVTLDAAALCLRSGNVALLRGGSEAQRTNAVLTEVAHQALLEAGLPAAAVQSVPTQERSAIDALLQMSDCIDLVIPRGGKALIERVTQNSRIAVVKHDQGICHVYVDGAANLDDALNIVENSKVQRPGVCNALETLLVDKAIAATFLPRCAKLLLKHGVELRGCALTCALLPDAKSASEADWDTEFLDLVLAIRVVTGCAEAIEHIDQHGSNHTACIVTNDAATAATFTQQVDASCVLVNASTRFNDGGELGLGAEMGISTSRIHAYGAMGAESLTCEKFVVYGHGQIRG